MTSSIVFLVLFFQLTTYAFLLPTGGGGGSCCCGTAPTCLPAPCGSSGCSSGFGISSFPTSGYSGGYSSASVNYAQPQTASYASPARISSYPSAPQSSYVQPQPSPVAPNLAPSPYVSVPSSYSAAKPVPKAAPYVPPPPAVPSHYADSSSSQVEQVVPSSIQQESQTSDPPIAAGNRLQVVEEETIAAKAELSPVAANSSLDEPTPPIDISLLKLTNDTECNNEDLREIIKKNISEDLNTSKQLIQGAAEQKFGGRFDIICATGSDFSYLSNTELFCQHTENTTSCYSYRQL